ncbi:hypothetical protein [Gordonia iterans]
MSNSSGDAGPDETTEIDAADAVGTASLAKALTPEEREALLAENRRVREEARARDVAKFGDEDDDDHDDGSAPDPGRIPGKVAAKKRRKRKAGPLVIALATLAAVLAVATGVLGYLYASASRDALGPDSDLGQSALADAKKYAALIVTYEPDDYAALDREIRAVSTPDFAERYIKASQEARRGNDEAKASSVGTARAAGLESLSRSQAVVLVALDQVVTSPDLPSAGDEGLEYQTRVQITLARDGDRWLVSELLTV